jgi:hypothetical protein
MTPTWGPHLHPPLLPLLRGGHTYIAHTCAFAYTYDIIIGVVSVISMYMVYKCVYYCDTYLCVYCLGAGRARPSYLPGLARNRCWGLWVVQVKVLDIIIGVVSVD